MKKVGFSRRAERDLVDIWEWVAQDNVDAADEIIARIRKAINDAAAMPGIGHARPDIADARYRFLVVYSYLIAYRVRGSKLTVVRVVHGARDLAKLFKR